MIIISRSMRFIGAVIALGGLMLLASCSSSGNSGMTGGSAGIAQAQFRATATAEAAATATQIVVDAHNRLEAAYARATSIAQTGVQSTLSAQDQEINNMVIADLRSQLTATAEARATAKSATATEVVAQQTEISNMRTATAVALDSARQGGETSARFWSWLGFILLAALVLGVILLFWFLYTRMSVRTTQSGKTIVIKGKPTDLIRRDFDGLEVEVIDPVDPSTLASAVPQLPAPAAYDPMVITQGKASNLRTTVTNKAVPTAREEAWKYFREVTMLNFVTVVYEYCREKSKVTDSVIPRWKTLADWDPDRVYINARWWTLCTDALEQMKVIKLKEQGKTTELDTNGLCKNVVDLLLVVTREKLLPANPPAWFRVQSQKDSRNSDTSGTVEQPEQSEQDINPELEGAVFALPRGN